MARVIDYDLTIAGAGPAGSVLALLCARHGMRVLLAERSRFDQRRVGESAPSELKALIAKLELGHVLCGRACRESSATVSIWGNFESAVRSHMMSPYGNALHLDRCAFDRSLADAAQIAGADLRTATTIRFEPRRRGGYYAITRGGQRIVTRMAVLAGGRSTGGCGLPYVRVHLDDHAAVTGLLATPRVQQTCATLIEAVPGGWFYLAQVSDDFVAVIFMTRAKSVPVRKVERLQWWLTALSRTTFMRQTLAGCRLPAELAVCDARASFAKVPAGSNWLAIGDARLAPDPLAGQGTVWAIEDAIFAAQAILDGRDLTSLWIQRTRVDVADYLLACAAVYAQERRFEGDPYWRLHSSARVTPSAIEVASWS